MFGIGKLIKGIGKALGGVPGLGQVFQQINKLINEIKQLASQLASIAMKPLMDIMDDMKILGVIADLARKVLELANLPFVKEAMMLLKAFNPALGIAIDKALQVARVASVLDSKDPETRMRAIAGLGDMLGTKVPVVGDVVKAFDAIAGIDGMQEDLARQVSRLTSISIKKELGRDVDADFTFQLLTMKGAGRVTYAPGSSGGDAARPGGVFDAKTFDAKTMTKEGGFSKPASFAEDAPVFAPSAPVFVPPTAEPAGPGREGGAGPLGLRMDHAGPATG